MNLTLKAARLRNTFNLYPFLKIYTFLPIIRKLFHIYIFCYFVTKWFYAKWVLGLTCVLYYGVGALSAFRDDPLFIISGINGNILFDIAFVQSYVSPCHEAIHIFVTIVTNIRITSWQQPVKLFKKNPVS